MNINLNTEEVALIDEYDILLSTYPITPDQQDRFKELNSKIMGAILAKKTMARIEEGLSGDN